MKLLLLPVISLVSALMVSACGNSSDSDQKTSEVAVRFSDAPIGELSEVVVTVDKLIFNRSGEDIIVDTFTSEELGIEDSDTFQLDLLEVQGLDNRLVLDSVTLPVGNYQNLRVVVLDNDINQTYVMEQDGTEHKKLKVPSGELKLGQFSVSDDASQTFVVEFALNQAMTYNPGPDRYILKPRGVRIVRLEQASHISGTVNLTDLHLDEACASKSDISIGNAAYLYAGHNLNANKLADLFIRSDDSTENKEEDTNVPSDVIQPLTSTPINGSTGDYLFSYLKPGQYTLAISCSALTDDPVIYDALTIPNPSDQLLEITLGNENHLECNFPDPESCSLKTELNESSTEGTFEIINITEPVIIN